LTPCSSGLQRSLAGLENFANVTTKRLDDTYYSLGEKLNALQGTITALKELAESSQKLNETFSAETEALVADINSQLDAFGQFEDQQRRIQSLQNRITLGRESIALLSKRVDGVRERMESWERADKEWQERTRKRLKVVWIVTSVVIFVVVLLYVGAQYTPDSLEATSQIASDGSNTLRGVAEVQADMLWTSKEAPTQWLSMALNGTGKGMVKAPSPEPEALLALDEL
jgi:ABC-type transporter Mla subunit MlaD